jgi:hypothetical protein
MAQTQKPNRVALYVALAIVALILIGIIVFAIWIKNFLGSPEGQKLQQGIRTVASAEQITPKIVTAIELYLQKNEDFPPDLDALKDYISEPSVINESKNLFIYSPPKPEDSDDTVILTTKPIDFIQGSTMKIEVYKNLDAKQITIAPLESMKKQRTPQTE